MKICAVINSLSGGGAERILMALVRAFHADGHEVTIITFKRSLDDKKNNETFLHICLEGKNDCNNLLVRIFRLIYTLRRQLFKAKPDRIVSFMDQANILTLVATIGSTIPIFVCERIYPAFSSLMMKSRSPLVRKCFRLLRTLSYFRASKIILQTDRMRDYFPLSLQKKMVTIANPIRLEEEALPVPVLEKSSIISIGRLVTQKRFDILINAFALLANDFPEWRLVIVGEGPLKLQLRELAVEKNIARQTIFLGRQENIAGLLSQVQIFALTSDYEGFPVALGEAMAAGLAIIASDCLTGPRELLAEASAGLLFPPGSSIEAANALRSLMSDPARCASLGQRALKRAADFDIQTIIQEWYRALDITP